MKPEQPSEQPSLSKLKEDLDSLKKQVNDLIVKEAENQKLRDNINEINQKKSKTKSNMDQEYSKSINKKQMMTRLLFVSLSALLSLGVGYSMVTFEWLGYVAALSGADPVTTTAVYLASTLMAYSAPVAIAAIAGAFFATVLGIGVARIAYQVVRKYLNHKISRLSPTLITLLNLLNDIATVAAYVALGYALVTYGALAFLAALSSSVGVVAVVADAAKYLVSLPMLSQVLAMTASLVVLRAIAYATTSALMYAGSAVSKMGTLPAILLLSFTTAATLVLSGGLLALAAVTSTNAAVVTVAGYAAMLAGYSAIAGTAILGSALFIAGLALIAAAKSMNATTQRLGLLTTLGVPLALGSGMVLSGSLATLASWVSSGTMAAPLAEVASLPTATAIALTSSALVAALVILTVSAIATYRTGVAVKAGLNAFMNDSEEPEEPSDDIEAARPSRPHSSSYNTHKKMGVSVYPSTLKATKRPSDDQHIVYVSSRMFSRPSRHVERSAEYTLDRPKQKHTGRGF